LFKSNRGANLPAPRASGADAGVCCFWLHIPPKFLLLDGGGTT
jgi:hypothetical protein